MTNIPLSNETALIFSASGRKICKLAPSGDLLNQPAKIGISLIVPLIMII